MKSDILSKFIGYLIFPFQVWFRLFWRNIPYVSDTGAKSIYEKLIFWIVNVMLAIGLLIILVYLVEAIKYIWNLIANI